MASADKTVFTQFTKARSIHRGFFKWKTMDDNQKKIIPQKELGIILCLFLCILHLALVAPLLEKRWLMQVSGSEAKFKEEHVWPLGPYAGVDSNLEPTPESTPTEMEFTKVKFRRGLSAWRDQDGV